MSFTVAIAKFSQVLTLLTLSLVCVSYASSSCRCNESPQDPIAVEALPNGALKIARLSHSLLPGTPATPHAFAVVMAAMFDAYGFALGQPRLTNATISYADAAQNADRIVMAAGASTIQEFVKSDTSKLDKLRQAISGDFYSIGGPFAKAIMIKFKTAPMPTSLYVPPKPTVKDSKHCTVQHSVEPQWLATVVPKTERG